MTNNSIYYKFFHLLQFKPRGGTIGPTKTIYLLHAIFCFAYVISNIIMYEKSTKYSITLVFVFRSTYIDTISRKNNYGKYSGPSFD